MKHFEEHVEDVSLILDEEECSDTKQTDMILDVGDRPPLLQWLFLSFQHVFAMFGATILVPTLTGLPVSVALFASGVGTLIYTFVTKRKVPVYLGSSFAYISAVVIAIKAMGGSVDAAQTGLMLVGVIYVVVALIVRVIGKEWIDKLLPPIVIGPMIAVIGLGLAANAVSNAQFIKDGDPRAMIVAIVTFLIAALISTKAKGFFKIIPFLIAILGGYVLSLCLGLVDFQAVVNAKWLSFPDFILPFKIGNFRTYNLYFGPETLAILPVALVTISEHIGDHIRDAGAPGHEAHDALREHHGRVHAHGAAEDKQAHGDAEGPGGDGKHVAGALVLGALEHGVAVDAHAEDDHEGGAAELGEHVVKKVDAKHAGNSFSLYFDEWTSAGPRRRPGRRG